MVNPEGSFALGWIHDKLWSLRKENTCTCLPFPCLMEILGHTDVMIHPMLQSNQTCSTGLIFANLQSPLQIHKWISTCLLNLHIFNPFLCSRKKLKQSVIRKLSALFHGQRCEHQVTSKSHVALTWVNKGNCFVECWGCSHWLSAQKVNSTSCMGLFSKSSHLPPPCFQTTVPGKYSGKEALEKEWACP